MPYREDNGKGKGVQLFSHPDVHIFFINPEEQTPTKRDTATLRLVLIPIDQDASSDIKMPLAFLEAGGWFYPLIPSKTFLYRTEDGYYVFPDLFSIKGASVGVVFPKNMRAEKRNLFERLLLDFSGLIGFPTVLGSKFGYAGTALSYSDDAHDDKSGYAIKYISKDCADGIMHMAGEGMKDGYELMFKGTGRGKSDLKSGYSTRMEYTGNAVDFGSDTINKLADGLSKVESFGSHYVQKQDKKLASAARDVKPKWKTLWKTHVKDGALSKMGVIDEALHDAGKLLAKAIIHNDVVDFQYGYGAGKSHIMEVGTKAIVTCNHNETIAARMIVVED